MNRGYKYRFYPTEEQKAQIEINLNCQRYIWNGFLALKEFRYKEFRESMSYNRMSSVLTQIKSCESWLKESDKWVLQQCLRHLDVAFQRFYKKIGKFPRFKSKRNPKDSYETKPNVKTSGVVIPKLGSLKIEYGNRPLDVESIGMCTIQKRGAKYYISFNVVVSKGKYEKTGKRVGLDLGLKTFAFTSDNEKYEMPKKIWALESRLVKQQRKLSKKKDRTSKAYAKQKEYVLILHERIANIRKDFQHKLTTQIVKRYDYIAIEDLNVKGMMSNKKLARAIGSCSFYEFRRMLEYKSVEHEKELVVIDRWFASSKTCSCCKTHKVDLKLSDRTYVCSECGLEIDRDYNASINIREWKK